jgi:FKBP-type peptidyl-prolyl cis-trans isomerase (trigger factor)
MDMLHKKSAKFFFESANKAKADAVNEIVNDTLVEALADAKVTPASRPAITKIDSQDKDTFSYTVTFEVFPDIKVEDFSKLKVEQIEAKITEADEEKTLKGLIDQSTEYKSVKRNSKAGDQVTIDFIFKPSISFSPNFFANSSSNFGDWGAATSFISTSNTTSLPAS